MTSIHICCQHVKPAEWGAASHSETVTTLTESLPPTSCCQVDTAPACVITSGVITFGVIITKYSVSE